MNQEVTTFQEKQYVWIWLSHESLASNQQTRKQHTQELKFSKLRKDEFKNHYRDHLGILLGVIVYIYLHMPPSHST